MKRHLIKSLIITLLINCNIILAAQPLFVGHRGSYWGVENTAEAFINGAQKGYQFLECDIKVAADGTIVLSHDDTTERLGGSLTINKSTLAQLKAETYTQTRGGVKYTGSICTLAEFLDICSEYNVRPVIELKWATGINSNDQSGMPKLINLIEEKGFRNKCVILTSMKPCLEYIRKNYPDISLQFLTNSNWANHFDWCVEWKMDVDIESGGFSKSTVEKFHEAGLKVNVWTVNSNDTYKTYGNMGCDFITTDYLDISNLPELNADAIFPPNLVDYPTQKGTVQGRYEPELVSSNAMPHCLQSQIIRKALLRNGKWYILSLDSEKNPSINIINAESGELISEMNMDGIEGGTIILNDIAFTADGELIGCNYVNLSTDLFKLYKWTNDNANAQVFDTLSATILLGNDNIDATTETFTISGASNDMYIYILNRTASDNTFFVTGVNYLNGILDKVCYSAANTDYSNTSWNESIEIHTTPFSRNNILINSEITVPTEYTFNWNTSNQPLTKFDQFDSSLLSPNATGIDFLRLRTKIYAFALNTDATKSNITARIYNVSDSIHNAYNVSPQLTLHNDGNASYMTCNIEYENEMINLYALIEGVGLYKYTILNYNQDATTEPETLDLALETIWEQSLNLDNAPENIDGTNAQQGAAFNGKFYVNDCVKKLLFVFDENGCIDSVAGGIGYGVACDDAGNVIIRNDKNTDGSHQFLIYPSNFRNNPTAITLNATIPAPGQTNFISASGDILGAGGYIYMFPNKQYAVNIIEVENGEIIRVSQSKELTISGSAAGYVIPMNNNSEQWIYHVRANGFYIYDGGESSQFYVGRSGTKAPQRNTTGGGDVFYMYGNQILLHNSGENYKGGFTVRNMTTNKAIVSVDPIGSMGYEDGGNYSTFNWLFAEKQEDGSFFIYQYCPSNGMAIYRLYDRNRHSTTTTIVESTTNSGLWCYPNPTTDYLHLNRPTNSPICIYDISGCLIKTTFESTINVTSLSPGIYILRSDETILKFIKQ